MNTSKKINQEINALNELSKTVTMLYRIKAFLYYLAVVLASSIVWVNATSNYLINTQWFNNLAVLATKTDNPSLIATLLLLVVILLIFGTGIFWNILIAEVFTMLYYGSIYVFAENDEVLLNYLQDIKVLDQKGKPVFNNPELGVLWGIATTFNIAFVLFFGVL